MVKKYQADKQKWESQSIQALRKHLGMSQQAMAESLGVRQQTISDWETGMYEPRGASVTLLSIVAEKANFKYNANST